MKRSASEIIRELETRVANIEKQSSSDEFLKLLRQALTHDRDYMAYGASYDPHVNEFYSNYKGGDFPSVHIEQIPEYDNDYEGNLTISGSFSVNVMNSTEDVKKIKRNIERELTKLFKDFDMEHQARKALNVLAEEEFGYSYDANYYKIKFPKNHKLDISVHVARYKSDLSTNATIKFSQRFDFEEVEVEPDW